MKRELSRRGFLSGASMLLTSAASAAATEDRLKAIRLNHGVPALGAMVVGPDGVLSLAVDGVRQAGGTAAVQPDELWHLGSNTKAMTAALYAKLVEEGQARWGLTMTQAFPALKMQAVWKAVTIEDLLSHHSGIADRGIVTASWLNASRTDPRSLVAQRLAVTETIFAGDAPGKRGTFAYANLNYLVASAVLEQLTGQAWEDLLRKHLFDPFKINRAGFGAPPGENAWGHRASWFGFGPLRPVAPDIHADNPPVFGPAGTVHMSLKDYSKFLRAFIAPSDVLSLESMKTLTQPRTADQQSYALGWAYYAHKQWARGPVLAHEGSNTLWHALTLVAPALQRAIVCVSNDHVSGQHAVQQLAMELVETL